MTDDKRKASPGLDDKTAPAAATAETVKSYRITLKGLALIAAVETGLLPKIEKDGGIGYDDELFGCFWDMYNKLAEEQNNLFRKKREHRA